ncbi:MAG: 1-deoxy-D-xylulose-5-phosphate reductoisomerase [Burkholderiaceae bacterium]
MRTLTILGATGSIGTSTLDVVGRHPERFRVHALTGHRRVELLAEQCVSYRPARAVVPDARSAARLRQLVGSLAIEIDHGPGALCDVAAEADIVMAAIVGAAGLPSVLAAARAGRQILLANKEALVMSGQLFVDAIKEHGATLLPIDSEHNAIFQCLPRGRDTGQEGDGIARVLLTASGGPFRQTPLAELARVTPDEACAHPNWVMGRKISVDSATMMNKGLEVIEARWLFDVSAERIRVLIHPQSVIHSMVSYVDGSVIAQLGNPDMRTPIAYALAYPDRIAAGVAELDLAQIGTLQFEEPDLNRFPCLRLAQSALVAGGGAPAILNAANEIAVEAFLAGKIGFLAIAQAVAAVLDEVPNETPGSLDQLAAIDEKARAAARAFVENSR